MYRLSLIISEIYNKYLPLAEKDGIILNLDFSDTTKEISDPDRIKQFLDEHLESSLKRSDRGEITIGVDQDSITITDSATTLSHAACTLLSNRFIDVTSRVGFGTTIRIFLKPRELPPQPAESPKLAVEGAALAIAANKDSGTPVLESEIQIKAKDQHNTKRKVKLGAHLQLTGKPASTSSKKPTKVSKKSLVRTAAKTKRELSVAAKKADKEVKRIAKKAEKQAKKLNKQAKKTTKTNANKSSSKSTPKAINATKKTIRKLKLS